MTHYTTQCAPSILNEEEWDYFALSEKAEWIVDTLIHRGMVLSCLYHSVDRASEHDVDKILFALETPNSDIRTEGHILRNWKASGGFASHVADPAVGSKHHSQNVYDAAGFMEMMADWKAASYQRSTGPVRKAALHPGLERAMINWEFKPHYDCSLLISDWHDLLDRFRTPDGPLEKVQELTLLSLEVEAIIRFISAYDTDRTGLTGMYDVPSSWRLDDGGCVGLTEPFEPISMHKAGFTMDEQDEIFYFFLANVANRYLSLRFWADEVPSDAIGVETEVEKTGRPLALKDFFHEVLM